MAFGNCLVFAYMGHSLICCCSVLLLLLLLLLLLPLQAVSALLKTPSTELFTNTEISVQPPSRGDMRAFYNNR
jgi:hypothetical protein